MKKLNVLLISLLLVTTGIIAQETRPVDDPNFARAVAPIHPIWDWEGDITIDGLADEGFWALIEPQTLTLDVTNSWWIEGTIPAVPSNVFDVKWKTTMDEDYFYIFVEVTDNAFVPRSAAMADAAWSNDNIELFFLFADSTVVMPDWSLVDASQFRIWPDTDLTKVDSITGGGLVIGMRNMLDTVPYPTSYMSRTILTASGYNLEARIPWILIHPSENLVLGYLDDDDNWIPVDIKEIEGFQFDINVADRNDPTPGIDPARQFIWSWSANWNRNWGFTEGYGWLKVGEPISNVNVPVISKNQFRVYPNPAKDMLIIDNLNGSNFITITNIVGQEIFKSSYDGERTTVDVSSFRNGVYFLSVINEKGERRVEKFLKR